MLDSLQQIFKTLTKSLEILYIIENSKPVSRIMANEEDLDIFIDFFKKNNLKYSISDYKIAKETDDITGYSNKGIKIKSDSKTPGQYFIYISKNQELADKAKEFEADNNHKGLGKLFGYPECCCNFFQNNVKEQEQKSNDYVLPALKESKGNIFSFWNNIAMRHIDLTLLSHFPCNFDCKESIKIAKANLKIIKKHSGEYHDILSRMLKGLFLYTENQGIYLLTNYKIQNKRISYKSVSGNKNTELYKTLIKNNFFQIIENNKIKLQDNIIDNIGTMAFI